MGSAYQSGLTDGFGLSHLYFVLSVAPTLLFHNVTTLETLGKTSMSNKPVRSQLTHVHYERLTMTDQQIQAFIERQQALRLAHTHHQLHKGR